jgi:hypothetical protein
MHNTHSSYSKDSMEAMKFTLLTIIPGRAKSDTKKKRQIAREAHDKQEAKLAKQKFTKPAPKLGELLKAQPKHRSGLNNGEESGEEFVIDEEGFEW